MRGWMVISLLALLVSCKSKSIEGDDTKSVEGMPTKGSADPVSAVFVDLIADNPGKSYPIPPCTEAIVTSIRGVTAVAAEMLAPGDVIAIRNYGSFGVKGVGVALIARVKLASCDSEPTKRIVRAKEAPELTFMNGTMHAHLDVTDRTVSPSAYFGRLSGTATIAEHTHPGTWELLCLSDGTGTATVNGQQRHLGPRDCVSIPPDTRHWWTPDPGVTMVAHQFYWPPGPEQRFIDLAAEAGAGSKDAEGGPDPKQAAGNGAKPGKP